MNTHSSITVDIAFPALPRPISDFWLCLVDALKRENALPEKFTLSTIAGHPQHLKATRGMPDLVLTPNDVHAIIIERGLTGFRVKSGSMGKELTYRLSSRPDDTFAHFTSWHDPNAWIPAIWNCLCESVLSRWSSIGCWICQTKYLKWQGEAIYDEIYERLYGPVPLGYLICEEKDYHGRALFDISLNPGRSKALIFEPQTKIWESRRFYPTAEMWLGPHFWQYARCTKEDALAADFWLETRDTPHYTYFKCWPTAFTRPDGEQGRMQQRLWKLFFHKDCEWPPGSETICDEPMYGPPELMPNYPG